MFIFLAMITTFKFFRVVIKLVNTELTLALPQFKKTAKIDQSGSQLSLVNHWVSQKYGYTPLLLQWVKIEKFNSRHLSWI